MLSINEFRSFIVAHIILTAILLVIQWYSYRQLRKYMNDTMAPPWFRWLMNGLFLCFNAPLLVLLFIHVELQKMPPWVVAFAVSPFYVWHFSLFLIFVGLMIGKLLKLPLLSFVWFISKFERIERWIHSWHPKPSPPAYNTQRRVFIRQGVTILSGVAFAGAAYGAMSKDRFEVSSVTVPVKNLPPAFRGFTIALLSDIHSSVFMTKKQMQRYVSATNSLHADLVAVTGDFVNGMVEEVFPFAEAFSELRAPSGVYGVLGNHDYYTRKVDTVAREVDGCGVSLLRNDRILLKRNGAQIYLAGVDDVGFSPRAAKLFNSLAAGAEAGIPKILLCHRPYFFDQAAQLHFDLMLSGHTHGGQIVFARIGRDVISPARVASPYIAGLYTIGDSHMYVSRGIGTVGIPIRVNCPPEITKITLVPTV